MIDHNPHLRPPQTGETANKGGAGSIERYDEPRLLRWQTRAAPPTDYENALGDALESLFTQEIYELPEIVKRLNEGGLGAPDGKPWTKASFEAEMKRLGDGGA